VKKGIRDRTGNQYYRQRKERLTVAGGLFFWSGVATPPSFRASAFCKARGSIDAIVV
jgi:hypothetical protein